MITHRYVRPSIQRINVDTNFLAGRFGIGFADCARATHRVHEEYVRAANKLQTAKGYMDRHERRYGARSAPEARTLLRQAWADLEQARGAFFRERGAVHDQLLEARRALVASGRAQRIPRYHPDDPH